MKKKRRTKKQIFHFQPFQIGKQKYMFAINIDLPLYSLKYPQENLNKIGKYC